MSQTLQPGAIGWIDLTVPDAAPLRDFYSAVTGWQSQPHQMDGYADFVMSSQAGGAVAGICHARGPNAAIPPAWLIYIAVDDFDRRIAKCLELGGSLIDGPRLAGGSRFAVLRDPAGASFALYETTPA